MELPELLRKKMVFAFCLKILSMRKSFFSFGFGWSLSLLSPACSCKFYTWFHNSFFYKKKTSFEYFDFTSFSPFYRLYRIATLAGSHLRVALITIHVSYILFWFFTSFFLFLNSWSYTIMENVFWFHEFFFFF